MEQLARITGIMCLLIITVEIIKEIGSFKSTEKVIKLIIAIYVDAAFFKISENSHIDLQFTLGNDKIGDTYNTEQLKSAVMEETRIRLESLIKSRLDEKNISYDLLSVHILEQNGNVIIDKIVIDCEDVYKSALEECLYDLISEDTQIVTGE